jgi:hypothetical protein
VRVTVSLSLTRTPRGELRHLARRFASAFRMGDSCMVGQQLSSCRPIKRPRIPQLQTMTVQAYYFLAKLLSATSSLV